MKPAKRIVHPLALAAVVFVAVVLALTFALGRQPPGPAKESTATVEPVAEPTVEQSAAAKPDAQTQAEKDAQAQADAERRRRVTNQIINTAIGVPVF